MIATILVWLFLMNAIYCVFYYLWQVAEGAHEHKMNPTINAVIAVIDTLVAVLIWIYLIPLVG